MPSSYAQIRAERAWRLLAEGQTKAQITEELEISDRTFRRYIKRAIAEASSSAAPAPRVKISPMSSPVARAAPSQVAQQRRARPPRAPSYQGRGCPPGLVLARSPAIGRFTGGCTSNPAAAIASNVSDNHAEASYRRALEGRQEALRKAKAEGDPLKLEWFARDSDHEIAEMADN